MSYYDELIKRSAEMDMVGHFGDTKWIAETACAEVDALRQQLAASVEKSERLNSEKAEEWHRANCEEETAAQLKAQLAASEQARGEAERSVEVFQAQAKDNFAAKIESECRLMRRIDALKDGEQARAENLESDSLIASCGCGTKTNEVRFHKPGCKYRLICERDDARKARVEAVARLQSFMSTEHIQQGGAFHLHKTDGSRSTRAISNAEAFSLISRFYDSDERATNAMRDIKAGTFKCISVNGGMIEYWPLPAPASEQPERREGGAS